MNITRHSSITCRFFSARAKDCCDYDGIVSELLEIRGLTVELPTAAGWVRPLNDVSLRMDAGESVGLVGELGPSQRILERPEGHYPQNRWPRCRKYRAPAKCGIFRRLLGRTVIAFHNSRVWEVLDGKLPYSRSLCA